MKPEGSAHPRPGSRPSSLPSRLGWFALRAFSWLGIATYYRALRIDHAERIPRQGPALFVANHPNALVDGGVLLRAVPRPVTIATRGRALHVPGIGWVLRKLGLLPLARASSRRRAKGGEDTAVLEPFKRLLQQGGAVLFFPEGDSHLDPELKRVRSGAARLALDVESTSDFELGLRIVPVGLQFEPASQLRGEVHVRVGEPFTLRDLKGVPRSAAVRMAQRRMVEALKPLMLHLDDVELEPLVRRVADLYDDDQQTRSSALRPRPRTEVIQVSGACLNHLLERDPEAVDLARHKVSRYERLSRRLGVRSGTLAGHRQPIRTAIGSVWLVIRLLLGLPFFLIGALTSYLPYRATDSAARRTAGKGGAAALPTLRILWGSVFFGLFWAALGTVVYLWSRSVGFTTFFLALLVVCAPFARVYAERLATWPSRMVDLRPLSSAAVKRVAAARRDLLQHVDGLVHRFAADTNLEILPPRRVKWYRRVPWRAAAALGLIAFLVWFAWGLRGGEVQELAGRPSPWPGLNAKQAQAVLASDALALESVLETLDRLETRMRTLRAEFDADEREFFDEGDARDVRQALLTYLNCRATLFRMAWFYREPDRQDEPQASARAFLMGYTAGVELCRRGMQLIEVFRGEPRSIAKLNEGDQAFGLPPDTYDRVRSNLAGGEVLDEMADATARFQGLDRAEVTGGEELWTRLWSHAEAGHVVVGRLADRRGDYTWDAAVARARRSLSAGRYELSKFFAGLISGVRVRSGELAHGLISPAQVDWLRETQLEPGDILLERRNWALSNVFLPGYWTHAALYVGGVDGMHELGILDHEGVKPHLAALARTDDHGNPKVVLEALGVGVVLNTLEYSVGEADAVCVLRPRMTRSEIAEAVARAMRHHGKPYDFDFDFFSADRLVCTELVYKAYQGPLDFELHEIMGRKTLPAIEILRKWAEERGTPHPQLEVVCFLDAAEDEGLAKPGDHARLLETLERPNLTLLQAQGGSARVPRAVLIILTGLFLLSVILLRRKA